MHVLLFLSGLAAWAVEPVSLDVELARNLGDGLFASGDSAGALQWYRVARWLDPSMDQLAETQLRVGMGLEATGDPVGAAAWYERVEGEHEPVARFRSGICRFRSGSPNRGSEMLADARRQRPALSTDAWVVEGALWLEAGRVDEAGAAFLAAAPSSREAAELSERVLHPPHSKSPLLAAGLSVIPGAGQMYTGAWGAGFLNLSLMAVASTSSWALLGHGETGHPWAASMGGATMAVGSMGWGLTVRDAWKRADQTRRKVRERNLRELQQAIQEQFPELPLAPAPDQIYGL